MDVSGIGSPVSGVTPSAAKSQAEQAKFESLLKDAMAKKDDAQLKKACKEFEGYYVQQLFNEMRKTIPKTDLVEASQGKDIYEDMLYEEYSKDIASGRGIGLADMLYKQLSNQPKSPKS